MRMRIVGLPIPLSSSLAPAPELRTRRPELELALEPGELLLVDREEALEVAGAAEAGGPDADEALATGRTHSASVSSRIRRGPPARPRV